MDNFSERQSRPNSIEQANEQLRDVFDGVGLAYYFSKKRSGNDRIKIAILGAGSAVEVLPLTQHFVENGLGTPRIVAFDVNPTLKKLSEEILKNRKVDFRYEIQDLTDPQALGSGEYDMMLTRNPDTVREKSWERIFANGFSHLKPGGLFIVSSTYRKFILDQLEKGGKVVRSFKIPEVDNNVFFPERDVLIAQKA